MEAADAAARRAVVLEQLRGRGAFGVPDELPVAEHAEEIRAAIAAHQVVIVAGETGSGKSTQIPKLCLDAGFGATGLIGHTQPRRVAARSIAERLAAETGTELGTVVGYTVRFDDRVSEQTMVRVMTDGVLLAEIQRDRLLRRYDVLIIDEAHERSLNVDFLLGYLTTLLRKRPELRLVITSATIDTDRFATHFADHGLDPVVIAVAGRTYPVEVRYRPFGVDPDDSRDQVGAICDAVTELCRTGPGDILVFLSGEREIHDTADALGATKLPIDILPLYARLSAHEQHRIFADHPGRRVVLATNIAETSITVPGVRFVVDTGIARISRYSTRLKVQRLPIEPVSQASARQRAGRCGRTGPGVCIRLYSEDDFNARPPFTEPEILRTNLASVILQMLAARLGDIDDFPFIEPPDRRAIRDGFAVLEELGAIHPATGNGPRRLTPAGRTLSRLPVDPRLARMVLEANRHGCVHDVLVIAAALSIPDPRERPAEHRQAADALHRRFAADGSDMLAFVRLWEYLRGEQHQRSSNQFRKLCRAEYLNYLRVREWQDLFSQLRRAAGDVGIRTTAGGAHPDAIHRSILSGLLAQIGRRDGERREYRGAHGSKFVLGGGSALGNATPQWVMAGQLVETDRLRARMCAPIKPEWAESLAGSLARRSHSDARWESQRGMAVCTERVSLFGLPIISGRAIPLERIDAPLARQLFIAHALVGDDADDGWRQRQRFLTANRRFLAELEQVHQRTRQVAVFDEGTVEAFYEARIPPEVTSTRHFDRWWQQARRAEPELLTMTVERLALGRIADADLFPTVWTRSGLGLAVTYRFEPGAHDDGATVHIPVEVLNQIGDDEFDWSIPGWREPLVNELVRRLPKDARRELQPTADTVAAMCTWLAARGDHGSFVDALRDGFLETRGVRVEAHEIDLAGTSAHLRPTIAVLSGDGTVLAAGKDVGAVRLAVGDATRRAIAATTTALPEVVGLSGWPPDGVARQVASDTNGRTVVGYPALVDDGDSVSRRIFSRADLAERVMRGGVRRLLLIASGVTATHVARRLTSAQRLQLAAGGLSVEDAIDDCLRATADRLIASRGLPWDQAAFTALVDDAAARVLPLATAAAVATARLVDQRRTIERRLDTIAAPVLQPAVDDVRAQLARLLRPGFVSASGVARLTDIGRYLNAVGYRIERLGESVDRDRQRMVEIHALEARLRKLLSADPLDSSTTDLAWQIEELRVATFAQQLGAAKGASVTRIARAINEAERQTLAVSR